MSLYTTELRYLIAASYDLGLDVYPIFDEDYRAILNQKIMDHYYFYEIGAETSERFKIYLNTKMNEIMPYYNQLYNSLAITINPLSNSKHDETFAREVAGATESETEDDNLNVESETPSSLLSVSDIKTNVYASKADRSDNKNTQVQNSTNLENYVRSLAGLNGILESDALISYRKSFLNIDMMVIQDLSDCFMGIY